MKKPLQYSYYLLKGKYRRKKADSMMLGEYGKTFGPEYAGKPYLDMASAQELIYEKIKSGQPLMVGRLGAVELSNMRSFEFDDRRIEAKNVAQLCECAGFFPNDPSLKPGFWEEMVRACGVCDLLGVWFLAFEDYYVRKYLPGMAATTCLTSLDPFEYPEKPWTSALAGRKVLVIHPQDELIQSQYRNRQHLFEGTDILPEFELKTLKAVQTNAGEVDERYKDWFEALEAMYREAMQIDFDIAILGCGAYGFPLAAKLKNAGKQAVHMGGITQILFGIRGKRWDDTPDYQYLEKYYNDYWVRVPKKSRPKQAAKVEDGCYW
jgi:hypothetical protein